MINIDQNTKKIEEFIQNSIDKFRMDNSDPNSIGIYCCPWAGWLTTNFNIDKTLEETQNNCPDFQFVEFDFLELHEWQEEYEKDDPEFEINGQKIQHNHDFGDEKFNELIFNYLIPIVKELKNKNNSTFLLQMLDSNFIQQV
ncbi:hypothetical protein [Fluviicola taffensis]|uniref:Uncharacterized protein n=1 Tax=Fluviicola taffensis (strain DSM 16823 / NCIMB 13979 / RW262) TaxID=755732 RepID=F2IFM3_FLUTR|nr:hypothetical protein [Fluviicola taffensis]AEA45737.1 hypothetical protein Fluta_3770 [Fluviicola taffensis DSM 16823]